MTKFGDTTDAVVALVVGDPIRATDANRPVVCVSASWSASHWAAIAAPNAGPDAGVTTPCALVPERCVIWMPGTADGGLLAPVGRRRDGDDVSGDERDLPRRGGHNIGRGSAGAAPDGRGAGDDERGNHDDLEHATGHREPPDSGRAAALRVMLTSQSAPVRFRCGDFPTLPELVR